MELATIATKTTCDLVEADAEARDVLMHEVIDPLTDDETGQVLGMVIAQLCDLFDALDEAPAVKAMVLRGVAAIREGVTE